MLIVALQDDVDNLYAIWNTVTDRFLGVNLGKYEAIGIIMDYKGNCTYEETTDIVEHPQPFKDIAKCLCEELNRDDNKVENAIQYLKEISWEIGTVSAECLSEKDGKKIRECVAILENRIDELEQ
jgi:hypothetical protein|nr:MAG TPA_asm: hypothetical protein [Caudoviricetes sp.]